MVRLVYCGNRPRNKFRKVGKACMKCKNCGYKTNQNKNFCPECGNPLSEPTKKVGKNKTNSKKLLAIICSTIILIAAIISFFLVGNSKFTPEKEIQAFETAVNEKDVDALKGILHPVNDSFNVTEENASQFLEYLANHPKKHETLINRLNEQVETVSSGTMAKASLNNTYATVNIVKDGKKWMFFDDYKIMVSPMHLDLYMDTEGIDLYVDDEKVGTSSGEGYHKEFGPYMPGMHKVTATFENSYISSSIDEEVELFNSNDSTLIHTLELDATEVEVSSIYDDSTLYINGEKTDITVGSDKTSIGMFPTNESVSLYAEKEFPWGTAKSEEHYINGDYVQFDTIYPLSEQNEEALFKQLNDTLIQYRQALSKKDASLLKTGATKKLKEQLADRIKEIKAKEPKYTGELLKAVYNKKSLLHTEYDKQLNQYIFQINAVLTYHEPNGDLGWLSRDEDKKNYTRTRKLTVIYDEKEKKWLLDKDELFYHSIMDDEAIEFQFN